MTDEQKNGPQISWITEEPRLGPMEGGSRTEGRPSVWWSHPGWEARFPWAIQGTTSGGASQGTGDFALFRESGPPVSEDPWIGLARDLGFSSVVHARQVHGRNVLLHSKAEPGLSLGPDADGHLASGPGILMAVTVADCVPVFLLDSQGKGGGVLHAGWRGVVAGILEAGVSIMVNQLGSDPRHLHLHLGPAICGDCYEVGPEVHEALGLRVPPGPEAVDLRALLAEEALGLGLQSAHITRSSHCTLCSGSPFFSHRGGNPERQVGFLGFRNPSS